MRRGCHQPRVTPVRLKLCRRLPFVRTWQRLSGEPRLPLVRAAASIMNEMGTLQDALALG